MAEFEKISVVMPIYNESIEELKCSLNSIINQTYPNLEIIVVNDNPLRESNQAFIDSISDDRVKVITNERNMGIVYSLNRGINEATSKYIARMDADDISEKDRLMVQYNELINRNLDLIGSNINYINENGEKIGFSTFPFNMKKIKKGIKYFNPIPHPTWLFKKEIFEKLAGYRNVKACEDYEFLIRCLYNNFKLGNVQQTLFNYRLRSNSISNTNSESQFLTSQFIYNSYKRNIILDEEVLRNYNSSGAFEREKKKLLKYRYLAQKIKRGRLYYLFVIVFNKYFYYYLFGNKKTNKIVHFDKK